MKEKLRALYRKVTTERPGASREIRTIAVCAAQVPFFRGGAEAHVESLVKQLRLRGYEVDLICLPYKWYPQEQLLRSIELWKMLDLSESNGKPIDLVIATKFPSYFVEHSNKVLWLIHQYRQIYDLMGTPYSEFKPSNKRHMAFRDRLVAMDTHALRSYSRIYTNAANTAQRLKTYNDIEAVPLYHPPRLAGRYRSGETGDYLLSVGRLDKLKRVDGLLRMLTRLDPRVRAVIAGTGPELEPLKAQADKLGVRDRVEFTGHVSDERLIQLYSDCALVYFAPLDEDYGYITLEAFLSGKPVVTASDSGGPLEFVQNGHSGIVLESLDPDQAAPRIQELFFDKPACRRMGENGRSSVAGIDWDRVITALLSGETP
jgi:glycosyltransferase involved in cell wall biosynthesis